MMNQHLREYIDGKIEEASSFVVKYMPLNLTTDQIYEGLVGERHVCEAFAAAIIYLPETPLNRRVDAEVGGTDVKLNLRFQPTEKYRTFLMPRYNLIVHSESDLGQSLATPIRVAQDWMMMTEAWRRMALHVSDLNALQLLFPWLHELLRDVTWADMINPPKKKSERDEIDRSIRCILRGRTPNRFPRMTGKLNDVCTSGRTLFSQYRMLEATLKSDEWIQAPATIERLSVKLPEWFERHLGEVLNDWSEEELERMGKNVLEFKRGEAA